MVVLVLIVSGTTSTSESKDHNSLNLSCPHSPFVGVLAYSPGHDRFPAIGLRLADPQERTVGEGLHDHPIPNSQYGRMVELPESPDPSKSVAVEVCDAIPGRYILAVMEHGKAEYHILFRASDGKDGKESQMLDLRADGDRICKYRFLFLMADGKVTIRWLDEADHPVSAPQCSCNTVPTL